MINMNENAKAVEKQAVVCVRLGHTLSQAHKVADARGWKGAVKAMFLQQYSKAHRAILEEIARSNGWKVARRK